jgi:type I restriction enzyme M protein
VSDTRRLVDKLWSFCNVLRDDGVSTIEYTEQLTFLLFLKMAHERETRPLKPERIVPESCSWQRLLDNDGDELEVTYRHMLEELARQPGTLGVIFRKAQNRIQDPAKLRRLVELINGETWMGLDVDIKGEIYEGLLEKNAQDVKSGAGQYFTPRPLIKAIVDVMQPKPMMDIADPACGTGGFLLSAFDHAIKAKNSLEPEELGHLLHKALRGWEIVDNTARLCVMNLYLHGIGLDSVESPITVADSLAGDPGARFDMVLTNPPFGKKSSVAVVTDDGDAKRESHSYVRDDFWVSTSNKQ